jgi:predicted DCC family thiol-disulfide oxidoreductase YuxK
MTPAEHDALAGRSILLYDGICGLCNRIIQLLLRLDRVGVLRFTPLQSSLGLELLAPFPSTASELEGVVLLTAALTPRAAVYRRADAVAEAFQCIGGKWSLLGNILRLVPRFLREWGYGIIARNRYRLFGKFVTCPIPTETQRSRILGV